MKEQVQRLNKTPGVETQAGVLQTGVTQTANMGYVQQKESKGSKLAKTLGMALGVATSLTGNIVETQDKKEAAFQALEGNAAGVSYGMDVIKQAQELPKEQRPNFIKQKLNERMKSFQGSDISLDYLKSNLNAFSNVTETYYKNVNASLLKDVQAEKKTKTYSLVSNLASANESHSDIMDKIMDINDVNRAEAGKIYTDSIIGMISNKANTDPSYDWQSEVNSLLKIVSKDGAVSYATHPVYGTQIRNLESNLTSLTVARKTKKDEADKKFIDNKAVELLSIGFNPNSTPEEIAGAKAVLEQNKELFGSASYTKIVKSLNSAESSVGFNTVANPVRETDLKAKASLGKLDLDTLELLKGSLTKSEYSAVASTIMTYDTTTSKTINKALTDGISDLEKSGRKLVAKSDAFGSFLEDNGADKANAFTTQWNSYLIEYQTQNEGALPTFEEATKKQQEIAESVKIAYGETKDTTTGTWEEMNVPAMSVSEIIKSGDPVLIKKAIENNIVKDTEVKQRLLNSGTREEIKKALDNGIIDINDITTPVTSSTSSIGFNTQLMADETPATTTADFTEMQNEAKALLGDDAWNEMKDAIGSETNSGSKIKALFKNVQTGTKVNMDKVVEHLYDREGVKYETYLDSLEKPTAGVGHLLSKAEQIKYPVGTKIPKQQVEKWFVADSEKAVKAAEKQANDLGIQDEEFVNMLVSVNFQLGTEWNTKFKNAYKALENKQYGKAISEIMYVKEGSDEYSDWYKQTPTRAEDFITAIENLIE